MEARINSVQERLLILERDYLLRKGRQKQLLEEKAQKEELLDSLKQEIDVLEQVRILLQQASEYAREQARQQIQSLVTQALQYVFGKGIEFQIEIKELRGRVEAEFFVVYEEEGKVRKDRPEEARGGGVVDVISLVLRVAMLQCYRPLIDGPLILDEPAKHVSQSYIVHVAQFLRLTSEMFKRQIIMVTHNLYLTEIADKAYVVELKDNKSIVIPRFLHD